MQNINSSNPTETTTDRATRQYDPTSRITWLDFDAKPEEETRAALKANGWRWSGYRKQWYNNRRWPTVPACVAVVDEGECAYAEERADRLQNRAAAHVEKSNAAYKRSNDLVAMIPFGQPILVGHHSERADRNRRAKSWAAMDKSVAEAKTAERLDYDAKSSAAHQAHKQTPEAMQRRVDRLSAELRKMQRIAGEHDARLAMRGEDPSNAHREYLRRIADIEREIADLAQRIKDAGGIKADRLAAAGIIAEKGDLVRIHGFTGVVQRVNPKTYTIKMARDGWTLKLDRTRLQAILRKHDGSPVESAPAAPPAVEKPENEPLAKDDAIEYSGDVGEE